MDKIKEKQKLVKEITTCLEEIEYIRKNYVFESELSFNDLKELDLLIGSVWLKYHKLYSSISSNL